MDKEEVVLYQPDNSVEIEVRVERLEQRLSKTEEKIDFFVRTSLPPVEGVFFEGQCPLLKKLTTRKNF